MNLKQLKKKFKIKNRTVEVEVGWFERLIKVRDMIDQKKIPIKVMLQLSQLFGHIESAKMALIAFPVEEVKDILSQSNGPISAVEAPEWNKTKTGKE